MPLNKETKPYIYILVKLDDHSQGWPEDPLFNTYYIEVYGRVLLFHWIATLTLDLYFIMLSVKQWGIKYYFF